MFMGRLINVRKQEDNHRKFLCVMNDVARNQHDFYNAYIKKELQYNISRQERSSVAVRKAVTQKKILQKCLELKREDTAASKDRNLYGHYGGKSIQSLNKDMDSFLAERHPKIRKKKHLDSVMKHSKEKGLILGTDKMSEKVRDYFVEKWGVQYPTQQGPEKKEPVFGAKKREEQKQDEPEISLSALFKPSFFPQRNNFRKSDDFDARDGDFTSRSDPTGHTTAEKLMYAIPGEDKHWNCKRCYHVDKVVRTRSRRAVSEHEPDPQANRLVLPHIPRVSSLVHTHR
ncbi:uncharacterized protein LOC133192034 [Saccostrea echinata]|uniref:uncharacterized protein LOC133192034 n=1 Tax=Saccostrea echinata TaxID=191078 RepID=UPI002A82C0AF|nr:uncharacterized protein LOC133192034 [Saccostrea echinata]